MTRYTSFALVSALQALLRAEVAFFKGLQEIARHRCVIQSDTDNTLRDIRHENSVHVARFLFMIKATGCNNAEAIRSLIGAHNAKIRELTSKKQTASRSASELQKAYFTNIQKASCIEANSTPGQARFTRSEFAAFLFEHMGRDSAIRNIDLLLKAGLLVQEDTDPLEGRPRQQIYSSGDLEDAFEDFLTHISDHFIEGNKSQ